jgi:hypothetical protein
VKSHNEGSVRSLCVAGKMDMVRARLLESKSERGPLGRRGKDTETPFHADGDQDFKVLHCFPAWRSPSEGTNDEMGTYVQRNVSSLTRGWPKSRKRQGYGVTVVECGLGGEIGRHTALKMLRF